MDIPKRERRRNDGWSTTMWCPSILSLSMLRGAMSERINHTRNCWVQVAYSISQGGPSPAVAEIMKMSMNLNQKLVSLTCPTNQSTE